MYKYVVRSKIFLQSQQEEDASEPDERTEEVRSCGVAGMSVISTSEFQTDEKMRPNPCSMRRVFHSALRLTDTTAALILGIGAIYNVIEKLYA